MSASMTRLRAKVRRSTGRCTHSIGGIVDGVVVPVEKLPAVAWVEIHEDEHGWFLLYFAADGSEITDGWHETLALAKRQAEFEFEIRETDWVPLPDEDACGTKTPPRSSPLEPMTWDFADPPNVATFIAASILDGSDWIHYVNHDLDGDWLFHPYAGPMRPDDDSVRIVGLSEVVTLDPTIRELSDLPRGWCAWRSSPSAAWKRRETHFQ